MPYYPNRATLRNLFRRYGWAAAVDIVATQFYLGDQAASVLRAAVQFDTFRESVTNMPRPFPGRQGRQKRRRTDYVPDPSSYQQISYAKNSSGKRAMTVKKLVYGNITRTDYWFKGLKAFDDNGYYTMTKTIKGVDAGNEFTGMNYPCYLFAPFHARQNGSTPSPMRRIVGSITTNIFRSQTVVGLDASGATSANLNVVETSVNAGQTFIGPRGLLKWTDVGLNLWGAKNKSTRYTIDFVRAVKEDCNPYSYASGTSFAPVLSDQFAEYLRPKVVNPLSTSNDLSSSGWKIVKRHVYDLDPIDLQEGDNDPHVKRVKLFNRWDRLVNFDWFTTQSSNATGIQINDPTRNDEEATVLMSSVRPEDMKDIFVIITATNYVPFVTDALFTNATDASFDLTFRSSWARIG